ADGNEIKFCEPTGRSGTFVQLNTDVITDARTRYKEAIGRHASRFPDLTFNFWKASFDAARKLFFLANFMPHMILCLDRSGSIRWCEGLGPGCCGGIPYALPNGLYVASGGCNGILSWFDADGHILFQSVPHEGEGLRTAYSNELQILSDGRVLVGGGPGLAAYCADGPLLWVSKECSLRYCVDSANGLLACCSWRKNENGEPNTAWLKVLDGL
ncbi:MAG: hypothetical protein ABSH20_08880, partial [Tepidisphaeraceae bacterium]